MESEQIPGIQNGSFPFHWGSLNKDKGFKLSLFSSFTPLDLAETFSVLLRGLAKEDSFRSDMVMITSTNFPKLKCQVF